MEKITFEVIKTSDGYFIKDAYGYVFDGEKPKQSWKRDWFKVKSLSSVKKIVPEIKLISNYVLSDEYVETESMPKKVTKDFFGENYYEHKLYSLYEPEYNITPETTEDIDFEIDIVAEIEGELVEKTIKFPVYGRYPNLDGKNWAITNEQLKLGLLDEIITPDILQQERPCELSSENSYKIIRTYIKDNINPKVAYITSDYDFCLTVEKRIPLAEKQEYKVDENFSLFGKRRKPRFITKYRTERNKIIYKIAPRLQGKVYDGYQEAPIFRGENAKNLEENIKDYLEEIIKEINKPIKDCPNCKGEGIIVD